MSIPDILPYVHTPDFVTPIKAALELRNARENAETQRMYAQSKMERESAQEARDKRDWEQKQKDEERRHAIEAAQAMEHANMLAKMGPGGAAAAEALLRAHGATAFHPLLATTAAAHAPQGDAVDQYLASPEAQQPGQSAPGPVTPPPAPTSTDGVAAPPPAPPGGVDPGVAAIMEGRTVQSAPEGDFVLPQGTSANLAAAAAHTGYIPQGSELLPPAPRPPVSSIPRETPAAPSPEIEALMTRGLPPAQAEGAKYEAPTNPLYEVVMNGQHYKLGGGDSGPVLGGKYDAEAQAMIGRGIKPELAYAKAFSDMENDNRISGTSQRALELLAGRNAETEKRDAAFKKTVEQQLSEAEKNRANARTVAAIRGAGGEATPKQEAGLAELLRMKENGALDSEISARAAELKIPEKAWRAAVKDVQSEASTSTRAEEKRASENVVDENGKNLGPANSPQEAADMRKKIQAWAQLKNRYQALIDDVKQNGERVVGIDATQRRNSLAAAAAAAARVYNGLGATDASQRLEAEILGARGTLGHGLLAGANVGVLEHVLNEAQAQHDARLKSTLRPGGGKPLPKAITHDKGGGSDLDALERQIDSWK